MPENTRPSFDLGLLSGIEIVANAAVPEGKVWTVKQPWGRLMVVIPSDPTPVQVIFRELRRTLARECPVTAPPAWGDLPLLSPSILGDLRRALSLARPGEGAIRGDLVEGLQGAHGPGAERVR